MSRLLKIGVYHTVSCKESPKALRDVITTPRSLSMSSAKENPEAGSNSSKRRRSVTDTDDVVSKRLCADSELPSGLQDKFRQNVPGELFNPCQTNQYRNNLPHALIRLMYQLDLSVLCSLRKLKYEHKYPSLSLAFEGSAIDKFNNIVFRCKEKSIYVQIENVDKYYTDNDISYAKLFSKERRNIFFINDYFNSFVKHVISQSGNLLHYIEYLIIYTNSGLDLTEEEKLKEERFRNFFPFKFHRINAGKCDILQNFLFVGDSVQGRGFYQFFQDEITIGELLKRLEFSPAMQKVIKGRKLPPEFEKEIKGAFLDKLVFAVNQPSREEMNSIVTREIENNSEVQVDYIALQEKVLRNLTPPEKHKRFGGYILRITYQFNLLMSFLHSMFLHKNMFSVNFEEKGGGISNDIIINYRGRITYVKAHTTNSSIGYSHLFPFNPQGKKDTLSINKHFTLFIEGLKNNIRYFIIYTDAGINFTEEKVLKKGHSNEFYLLKFNSIDIRKKKYKILRNCSCINENNLYQFAREETIREKLLSLLKLPPSLQKEKEEGRLSGANEKEVKEKFLDKLILAVNQPSMESLNNVIRNEIDKSNVPYNYAELHEVALRWSESRKFGDITKGIMEKLLEDIKNNKFSYQKIKNENINEKMKFAKSVVGREGTQAFNQFLDFLIEDGRLEILQRKGINLGNMSSILNKSGANAAKAFKDLYDLWFDEDGKKTRYLKTLDEEAINLPNMSSILHGVGAKAAKVFKDLYDLWFDEEGKKTRYLKTLEEEGINLPHMSSILGGAGATAAKAFKDLYDLWFDEEGKKTRYLKTLEEERINLPNMSSILSGAGANSVKAFKDLYDLWFDEEGNKTQYLKTLEEEGINLPHMSSILSRAGANAPKAFKDLYDLWFDEDGKKTRYLKTLDEEAINLPNMSSILHGVGAKAAKAFKDLYDLWFDEEGKKTRYLKTLEEEGINLPHMSSILHGVGAKAAKAFKDLYDLWFDEEGKKTRYLKTLEEEGINLPNMSSILHGVGAKAAKAFKDLYDLWFDEEGKKTRYLKTLEEEGINLPHMSSILGGAGATAAKAFKDLYDLWFDEEGKKTRYLKTLEEEGINLPNMSSILSGAGANSVKAFKDLYDLWFDEEGNKTQYLKTLDEEGVNLANMSSILNGTGIKAAKAFKGLYDLWFDEEGNKTHYLKTLEEKEIDLSNMSSILHGAGAKAPKAFKELCNTFLDEQGNKKLYLEHFIKNKYREKSFRLWNLSSILSKAGVKAKDAFEKLHNICFNDEGKRTELLDDFYKAGFRPSNLSSILCGTGVRASSILKRLHSVCFNEKREKTKLLDDFCKAGFRMGNICRMLSGAADSLEKFHNFCFIGETKRYLNRFLNEKEGFTLSNLSKILHGAGTNIYSALKDFHDVCFDEKEKKTQLLDNFHKAGFRQADLSNILSMAGSNATSILSNFHNLCFNEKKYLDHFLAEEELFTPKGLSKILHGVGINICSIFEKLHEICFDKAGTKTKYLNTLMKTNPPDRILDILYVKARKAPYVVLDDTSLQQQNISGIEENKKRKYR
ncbi:uncharacterized protein LOC143368725 [Andrena cerasifolii]|uniref:uncharacterized protein LOC143368725 n=1 Tax=Andrena cerasifolii TaxID=2819439 RepID=UPI004037A6BB